MTHLTYFLCLLWENRAVDLSPPTCSVSCSGNSFAPGWWNPSSASVLLQFFSMSPSGALWSSSLLVPRLRQCVYGFCWLFRRNTCPIQRNLRLLICSLMVQVPARALTSSFDTFIGQYIFSNLRRHLCRNVSGFASSLFDISLQVSHCYDIGLEDPDLHVFARLSTPPDLS